MGITGLWTEQGIRESTESGWKTRDEEGYENMVQ